MIAAIDGRPARPSDSSGGRPSCGRSRRACSWLSAGRSRWRRFSSGRRRGWLNWPPPRRDFEYLSGFASPPFHLVNYVAPGLFHRSPLWRPLVWDPFHAMPEEHLAYVGLVPLFLACMTMVREWRRDPGVRLLDHPCRCDAGVEPWALCSGVSLLDHAARLFVLSCSRSLEPGDGAGPGLACGQGIRSLARMVASRAARSGGMALISICWVGATWS